MASKLDLYRKVALLEGTLKEMLRIHTESAKDPMCIPPEEALEGKLLRQWKNIEKKAQFLVGTP